MTNQPNTQAIEVRRDYDDVASQALAFAQSGFFKDVQKQSQAVAKILAGRELGFAPWASMSGVHIITTNQGTSVQIGATLLAAAIQRHPRYDYRIIEHSNEKCEIQFIVDGEPRTPNSVYTLDDARRANLVKDRGNWVKVPRNMVFARAMSNGAKWHCPDVFGGAAVYTEGDDIPDQITVPTSGPMADMEEIVDAEVVEEPVAEAAPEVPAAPAATQGQLAAIAGMCETIDDFDKDAFNVQLTAQGVSDIHDLSCDGAEAILTWLKGQVEVAVAS